IVIPPAIFFYYSTLFDSRFKTLQQNPYDQRTFRNSRRKEDFFSNRRKYNTVQIKRNAKKEMPKHFLTCDLSKTTAIDKEPNRTEPLH
ncbi:hypothetical protein, partial [Enterococcus faecium]|uniref:hypothetical protein n=1 Tax=Enterococcus faecium TaxID=1352 RepID=UPI00321BD90C